MLLNPGAKEEIRIPRHRRRNLKENQEKSEFEQGKKSFIMPWVAEDE
jgi:hypothetical protein